MANTAGDRVAHIPELLEQILFEVIKCPLKERQYDHGTRIRTVLLSQSCSQAFQSTIQGSAILQNLFLKHLPTLPTLAFPDNRVIYDHKFRVKGARLHISWHSTVPKQGRRPARLDVYLNIRLWQNKLKGDIEPSWRKMYLRAGDYVVTQLSANEVVLPGRKKGWKNATLGELYDVAFGKY